MQEKVNAKKQDVVNSMPRMFTGRLGLCLDFEGCNTWMLVFSCKALCCFHQLPVLSLYGL